MTTREIIITRAGLTFLHSLEGGQATEVQIHAAIIADEKFTEPKPSAHEVAAAIANWDAEQWVVGVPARFNKRVMKWNITDAGEAARLQL